MPKKAALTYDEINRKTVLAPDSSVQPSKKQEAEAVEQGERDPFPEEALLRGRAQRVLASVPGIAGIAIELDGPTVVLRGNVRDAATLRAIDQAFTAHGVPLNNQLVVS